MSRIGKQPIVVPSGVEIKINGSTVWVKGKLGVLERTFTPAMSMKMDDGKINVSRPDDSRQNRALHGLTRSLISNMVIGVSEGFKKQLKIEGVGYRVMKKGKTLEFSLGYSHPIKLNPPDGIDFEVEGTTGLTVLGIDKALVGQVAANIRKYRKPEPYKGKGIRYLGEHVRRKAGKTMVK
ncbi:LSU ribosomal protein L6p (L9e) [hydrothermal vent metagenome]|uniref:LSU ribosomal protein L6p (L9e) n=1 Tax=hydrothermal vent metagenome TaxID=652676 RepID=A0A3B1CM68_9ZZZZ